MANLSHPGLTGYDQSANKKQLLNHFKDFSAPVLRMLSMAPDDNVKLWDLLDMELQPSLIKGKAVLIGDAAHPYLPRELPRGHWPIRSPLDPSSPPSNLSSCS